MKKILLPLGLLLALTALLTWLLYLGPRQRGHVRDKALEAARSGDCAKALEMLEGLEGDQEIVLARARCRRLMGGDPLRAGSDWTALETSPDPAVREEALYRLAELDLEGGNSARARERLKKLLEVYPAGLFPGEALCLLGSLAVREGNRSEAIEHYRAALAQALSAKTALSAREQLSGLDLEELLAGSDLFTEPYRVRGGDNLAAVAGLFHTTPELLRRIGGGKNDLLRIGQVIRVPSEKFEAVVSKENHRLTLLFGGEFFAIFAVGTGKENSTPEGEFEIATKLIDPVWFSSEGPIPPGDSRNILGTRWMGFQDPYASYGIHGTTQPETVGTASSSGCVRMLNPEVELLFDLLPRGTRVTVIP